MADNPPRCADELCGHPIIVHTDAEGPCRVTGCGCAAFTAPEMPTLEGPRRVCIDLPDGYIMSFTLMPQEAPDA